MIKDRLKKNFKINMIIKSNGIVFLSTKKVYDNIIWYYTVCHIQYVNLKILKYKEDDVSEWKTL